MKFSLFVGQGSEIVASKLRVRRACAASAEEWLARVTLPARDQSTASRQCLRETLMELFFDLVREAGDSLSIQAWRLSGQAAPKPVGAGQETGRRRVTPIVQHRRERR